MRTRSKCWARSINSVLGHALYPSMPSTRTTTSAASAAATAASIPSAPNHAKQLCQHSRTSHSKSWYLAMCVCKYAPEKRVTPHSRKCGIVWYDVKGVKGGSCVKRDTLLGSWAEAADIPVHMVSLIKISLSYNLYRSGQNKTHR